MEDGPHVPPPAVSVPDGSDQSCGATAEAGDDAALDENGGETVKVITKSCLKKKKKAGFEGHCAEKKQVQWVDLLGKELAEVKEFESRWVNFSLSASSLLIDSFDLFDSFAFYFL